MRTVEVEIKVKMKLEVRSSDINTCASLIDGFFKETEDFSSDSHVSVESLEVVDVEILKL